MSRSLSGWGLAFLTLVLLLEGTPVSFSRPKQQAHKQEKERLPAARELRLQERIKFPDAAPEVFSPSIKCGPNGAIYAEYSETMAPIYRSFPYSDAVQRLPFYKLSVRARSRVSFPLPTISDYPYLLRDDFQVDAHGGVWALFDAYRKAWPRSARGYPVYFIIRYRDDGSVDSKVQLGNPQGRHFFPHSFAVFSDGSFLVTGSVPVPGGLAAFAGIFDRYGHFEKNLSALEQEGVRNASATPAKSSPGVRRSLVPAGGRKGKPKPVGPPPTNLMISSANGNVYLLCGGGSVHLYAVSPAGKVLHDFELPNPPAGLTPFQMASAGISHIFIEFGHLATGAVEQGSSRSPLFEIVRLSTGKVTEVYHMNPEETGYGEPGCASSPYELLFLGGGAKGKLEVLRFTAP